MLSNLGDPGAVKHGLAPLSKNTSAWIEKMGNIANHQAPIAPAVLGKNGLVITADSILAERMQSLLAEFGCKVQRAESADQANDACYEGDLNPVFVDVREEFCDGAKRALESLHSGASRRHFLIALSDSRSMPPTKLGPPAKLGTIPFDVVLGLPADAEEIAATFRELYKSRMFPGMELADRPFQVDFPKFTYETYCAELGHTLTQLAAIAKHDVTLLLTGETGTGKTTLATALHDLSGRHEHRLITVPCGALSDHLIESELFGHVQGAFTGADKDKIGKFAAAGDGTLLLDEIDVLGPAQQAKLLRVIETGEFERVGDIETRVSSARIIVASNRCLAKCVEQQTFRSDLYYRLNVLEFNIPALRQRRLDIVAFTRRFIEEFQLAYGISIRRVDPKFLQTLYDYDWPGNLRELKNHIRRAVLFSKNGELTTADLGVQMAANHRKTPARLKLRRVPESLSQHLESEEREVLKDALRKHDFKRTVTANALGISRVGLYKKMKKYDMLTKKAE